MKPNLVVNKIVAGKASPVQCILALFDAEALLEDVGENSSIEMMLATMIWYAVCFCPRSVGSKIQLSRGSVTSMPRGFTRYSHRRSAAARRPAVGRPSWDLGDLRGISTDFLK